MAAPRDSSGHPLHGARLKHDRAVEELAALNEEVRSWLTENRPELKHKPHADRLGGDLLLKVRMAPPEKWALEVGGIVHHLRSALDHVAWKLAERNGLATKRTAFPTSKSRRDFRRSAVRNLGLTAPLVEAAGDVIGVAQGAFPQHQPFWTPRNPMVTITRTFVVPPDATLRQIKL